MKNDRWVWIAGTIVGIALSVGACRQEEAAETPQSSVTMAPNPAPEKSSADNPSSTANAGPNAETFKVPQDQKPYDAKKPSKG
jgi:hypothetical protein